jgi:hypothetical protein
MEQRSEEGSREQREGRTSGGIQAKGFCSVSGPNQWALGLAILFERVSVKQE